MAKYRTLILNTCAVCYGTMLLPLIGSAQHLWQKPKAPIPKTKVESIIGPYIGSALTKPRNVVWVWGYDKPHQPGAHDYLRIRDLMTGLLDGVPDLNVETAYQFPTPEQFDRADLVVMYLHLPQLNERQYLTLSSYLDGGGGLVAIHETAIIRPAADGRKLAECLGMSWDEGRSKWGAIFEDITIENRHPIFAGFPKKLTIADEFYWDLNEVDGVEVLGSVRTGPDKNSIAPVAQSKLSENPSPMFWTFQPGQGRVFGTTLGHNTFSYYDPELRIILFRAMAWAMREKPEPFMPLVFDGITSSTGMVGTRDSMRNWEGKQRGPTE